MSEKLSELERVLRERGKVSVSVAISPNNTDEFRRFELTLESFGATLAHDGDVLAAMKKFPAKRLYAGEIQDGKIWAGKCVGPMAADFYADFSAILSALDGAEMGKLLTIIQDTPGQSSESEGFSA